MRDMERRKNIRLGLVLAAVAFFISFWSCNVCVHASGQVKNNPDFDISAVMIASDKDTYNIQLDVENKGKDWEGTVRLLPSENYYIPTAYDTALTLPSGSKKQFVVKVPKGSGESLDGDVKVLLLNKKSKVVAEERVKGLLLQEIDCITMGILSDDYSSLTYLDMGGATLYYYGTNMPVKLVEINQDNMENMLSTLTILVIDKYNTSVLTDEQRGEISDWVDNGGLLVVGTGSYVKDTLGGLGDVLPDVTASSVVSAGTEGGTDSFFGTGDLDVSKLDMAQLKVDTNKYMECYFSYGYANSKGNGAVAALPFSLVDLNKPGETLYVNTTQETFVQNMLEELACYASARYNKNTSAGIYNENMNMIQRMLGILGNISNTVNFGVLKFLVILYVIFVGPVLYLILRAAKKREWYWVTVPVTALVGIVLIFFAGRGFEVADTRVYSVTTRDVAGTKNATTYMYCYDAGHKEWDLKLRSGYEYAGALMNSEYGYLEDDDNSYYHHIQSEGGRFLVGIDPSSSFENSFFYAGKKADSIEDVGTIKVELVGSHWGNIDLQVTNNTNKDFKYYGVVVDSTLYVYKDLGAGQTMTMGAEVPIYTSGHGFVMRHDYIYNFIRDEHRDPKSKEDITALSALGVGLSQAYPISDESVVAVCGVIENWEPAIDDECNETSYGCLYVVERQ